MNHPLVSGPITHAMGEALSEYAGLADAFASEERHPLRSGGQLAVLAREPVGVVAAIIPWNGPISMIRTSSRPRCWGDVTKGRAVTAVSPTANHPLEDQRDE